MNIKLSTIEYNHIWNVLQGFWGNTGINGTIAGQVKYVCNRTGGSINVNGSSLSAGATATFYWSGSAWL